MRALFVAPYLPTHGSGGRTRLINLMERLGKDHELSLVAFAALDQDPADNPYPGAALRPLPSPARGSGVRGTLRFYRERTGRLPLFVRAFRHPGMVDALRGTIERFRPDVVQVEHTEMAQYLPFVPAPVLRVFDQHDVVCRWLGRAAALGATRKDRAIVALERIKTRRFEARAPRTADLTFVMSAVERAFLRDLSGVDAIEVPNGVDTASFVPMPGVPEEPGTLLFVGPLTSEANRDAVSWFVREVLPLVLAEDPGVRLDVVGTPADLRLPPSVRLLGRVADVRPHLARAPVSVVPIRVASGTRYKILEALSMERVVVSTTAGAEGLETEHRRHLLIADDAPSFARAVIEALRDPGLRARLGAEGRRHVAARFDWGPLVERVGTAWEEALAAKRRAR